MEKQSFKNWWTYTAKGIFALAFGLIALFIPDASASWLVQLFGGFVVLSGLFLLAGSLSNIRHHKKWGLWFLEALTDLVLGILIIIYHHSRADLELFIIFVAIWAIGVGFTQLFASQSANQGIKTRWLLLLNALIVIAASFVLFFNPFETMEQTLNMIGVFAVVFGVFITIYSFGLKEG
jgi:uncharacterized membrane protein HdeD (DUF308 family)